MSDMIPDLESYFRGFVPQRNEWLRSLEQEAVKEEIPIVGPAVGELLYLLARTMGARKILELGTATGYSAIYLAQACEATDGHIVTIENDPGMAARAQANFETTGHAHRIEVKIGDAGALLAGMDKSFDLIFLDIDKEFYLDALPHCVRLLRIGGLLISDNVGFQLSDAFNHAIFVEERMRTVHLLSFLPEHSPEKDGLCLAVRIK